MNILFIGDIFGRLGIKSIQKNLEEIKQKYDIDLVIANGENTTKCRGLNNEDYLQLKKLGIDYITMGNHTWRQNDWHNVLSNNDIIRPYNINDEEKEIVGSGSKIINFKNKKIRITNLIGCSLKSNFLIFNNPFVSMQEILNNNEKVDIDIVDFHTETTSEKNCFLYAFKSKVNIILGTHTHVQTNDARIVDNTAYISDVGMTGPSDGVIGAEPNSIVEMFFGRNQYFRLKEAKGKSQFCAVVITIDNTTNKATKITNIYIQDN